MTFYHESPDPTPAEAPSADGLLEAVAAPLLAAQRRIMQLRLEIDRAEELEQPVTRETLQQWAELARLADDDFDDVYAGLVDFL